MVRVHVRERIRFGVDQLVRIRDSGHEVISFQVGGASEAGIEMGRHDAQPPERKIREARIQL